jgi:hypothetical protein
MEMQGHFSPYAVLQFNRPDVLYDVPKMLVSSYGPLALKWSYVPKMFNWFLHYLKKLQSEINDAYRKKYASNFKFIK